MDLREIQEKADELAISLLATDSKNMAMLYGMQIEGLKDLASIIAASDRRDGWHTSVAQREQDTELRRRELAAMETAAAAAERASTPEYILHGTKTGRIVPGPEVYLQQGRKADTVDLPEPIKPVADRLHELVSYLVSHSVEEHHKAEAEIEGWKAAKHEQASKSYDDAATKLQEILTEGGI